MSFDLVETFESVGPASITRACSSLLGGVAVSISNSIGTSSNFGIAIRISGTGTGTSDGGLALTATIGIGRECLDGGTSVVGHVVAELVDCAGRFK